MVRLRTCLREADSGRPNAEAGQYFERLPAADADCAPLFRVGFVTDKFCYQSQTFRKWGVDGYLPG